MNLQYLRYALEIARTGSISKAAENLSVAQPNLSRAVKELEAGLGITIFDRTRTGMTVTPEGEKLLSGGERLLREMDELESMFGESGIPRETVTLIAPPAAYLSVAIAEFCRSLSADCPCDILCRTASSTDAMAAVARGDSRLGIIRIPMHFEAYFADQLKARDLRAEVIAEFTPMILAGRESHLAEHHSVQKADLAGLHELVDPDAPWSDTVSAAETLPPCRLTVSDRSMCYTLLAADSTAYTRSLPMPAEAAERLGLIMRPLVPTAPAVKELLIYPAHYRLTAPDRRLLECLQATAKAASCR